MISFYDRQTESCSLLILTSGEIRLIEPVPDLLDTLFRNTDSRILHGNKDFLVLQRSLDIDQEFSRLNLMALSIRL